MKTTHAAVLSAALVLAGATYARTETVRETTTEKTTTYSGTVTEFTPGAAIVLKSDSGDPRRYVITDRTTFVDGSGNVVSQDAIRDRAVTVTYAPDGDRMVVSKVLVTRPTTERREIERERTIEEHR